MSNYNNFEKEIPGWSAFIEECKKRAKADEKELHNSPRFSKDIKRMECGFMYNPEICPKPKYLLLGMEPTISKNPLFPEEPEPICCFPLFLNYCAYKYLCKENFNYYITDLVKGTMSWEGNEKIKGDIQKYRYIKWLPLFAEQLKLLGEPKVIVIGKGVYDIIKDIDYNFVKKHTHPIIPWIQHYSPANRFFVTNKIEPENLSESDLKEFRDKFKNHLLKNHTDFEKYENAAVAEEVFGNKGIKGGMGIHNRRVIAYYKNKFNSLAGK